MKRAPEPGGTIKPLWNIIPDGTLTDYTPTTLSIDTHNRENTRITKCDLAIATETHQKQTPPQTQEPKPGLMHFVACKTVREYNRNREKIRKICLEEKKHIQREHPQREEQCNQVQHAPSDDQAGPSTVLDNQEEPTTTTFIQTGLQKIQTLTQKSTNGQKRQTERKRKNVSTSEKTTRPTKNKPSQSQRKQRSHKGN